MYSEERAQTEVIGVILLIGISTMVIGGSIVVATGSINDFSLAAQSENGENSISHVEAEISAVAIGDSVNRKVSLSRTSDGRYLIQPDSGQISMTYTESGTEEWNLTRPLGAIVYNSSDRDIAYQGGGVWSKEDDYTSIVSQPEFDYERQSLTFPIIQVRQDGGESVSYESATDATTLESDALNYPLKNGSVKIEVTSKYYEGWYEYFDSQTETKATIHHNNNTATATLVVPDTIELDNAVSLATEYDPPGNENNQGGGNNPVVPEDELEENVPHESADSIIDTELNAAESSNDNDAHSCVSESGISGDCELTAGTYYIDSDVDLSGDLTLDVSAGNITLATEGTFDINSNSVNVEGDTNHGASYYIADDLQLKGNSEVTHATGGSEIQNQFFVGDQFTDDSSGNGNILIEGIIYAAESDTVTGGNLDIQGAVILQSLSVNGQAGQIRRGDVPPNYELDVTGVGDTIRFMHVTTNRVTANIVNSDLSLKTASDTGTDPNTVLAAYNDYGDTVEDSNDHELVFRIENIGSDQATVEQFSVDASDIDSSINLNDDNAAEFEIRRPTQNGNANRDGSPDTFDADGTQYDFEDDSTTSGQYAKINPSLNYAEVDIRRFSQDPPDGLEWTNSANEADITVTLVLEDGNEEYYYFKEP